nr:RNA-dependent RNA polymerase [Jasmine virus C]
MALTYRTPMEDIVSAFEPAVQAAIASTAGSRYKQMEENNFDLFNFHMDAVAKQKLSRAGVYLSPYSAVVHSHPVCKTLENYILYKVLPSYLSNKFVFVGIKNNKLSILKARNPKLDLVQAVNRYVTSADKSRYGNEFVYRSSKPHEGLLRHARNLSSVTLKDLVPPLMVQGCKELFLHDELHYYGVNDLCTLLEVLKPNTLLGTVVYPPELLVGVKTSLNKWCYDFEIVGSDLMFYPDGVRAEGYMQPLSGGFLLKSNKIELQNGDIYCVDILCSKFAHHLVAITRGDDVVPKYRAFSPFDAVGQKELQPIMTTKMPCIPVSFELVSRIYRYLRTLKKPDKQSAMAKLSQICVEPTGFEISFVQEFADLVIGTGSIRMNIDAERVKGFFGRLGLKLPGGLASLFGVAKEVALESFIERLTPYTIGIKLRTVTWGTDLLEMLLPDVEVEPMFDIVDEFSVQFTQGKISGVYDRVAQPYYGICGVDTKRGSTYTFFSEEQVLHFLPALVVKVLGVNHCRDCDSNDIEVAIRELERRGTILGFKVLQLIGDVSKICSEVATRVRRIVLKKNTKTIFDLGVKWFFSGDAQDVLFLESVANDIPRSSGYSQQWQGVVQEVLHGGVCLRKTRNTRAYSHMFRNQDNNRNARNLEIRDLEQTKTSGEECERTSSTGCDLCDSCMKISPLKFSEHLFTAQDQLKDRRATWYSKDFSEYKYNGGKHKSAGWPEEMELWVQANEIPEKYDCCLVQQYADGAKLGLHADDEGIFEPGESILTVNLSGTATFLIKCGGSLREIHCDGPGMFTMPKGFQFNHKHGVKNTAGNRWSATFRCLKRGITELSGPEVGVVEPVVLNQEDTCITGAFEGFESNVAGCKRSIVDWKFGASFSVIETPGDGSCFWHAMSHFLEISSAQIKIASMKYQGLPNPLQKELAIEAKDGEFASDASIYATAIVHGVRISILDARDQKLHVFEPSKLRTDAFLYLRGFHFEPIVLKNGCVVKAIASLLERREQDVLAVIERRAAEGIREEIWRGLGLCLSTIQVLLELFDIRGVIKTESSEVVINAKGRITGFFELNDDHMTHIKRKKDAATSDLQVAKNYKLFSSEDLLECFSMGTKIGYMIRLPAATILADSFNCGNTGVLLSDIFNDRPNFKLEFVQPNGTIVDVNVVCGTFGSGKSYAFKQVLKRANGKIVDYVAPRRALKDAMSKEVGHDRKERKAGQENWNFTTFEKFLDRCKHLIPGQLVCFDEFQLYPPGYFDLTFSLAPAGVNYLLLGDPCQSDYDCERDRSNFIGATRNVDHLLDGQTYKYIIRSKRFVNVTFCGRLPAVIDGSGLCVEEPYSIREGVETIPEVVSQFGEVVLVSSFDEKKVVQSYAPEAKALTFGESTGMTFERGSILITAVSERSSEVRWLTALSRFRRNLCFIICSPCHLEGLKISYRGRFLWKFLTQSAAVNDLKPYLPGNPVFLEEYTSRIGKDEGVREEKLLGDPWLKGMVDLMQQEDVEEVVVLNEVCEEEWFKTHLPRAELESVRARWAHRFLLKELREHRIGCLTSEQFTDEYSKQIGGVQLSNAAERFEAIYPRHRASDTVTFLMAVKKRLRFSKPAIECAKLANARNYGKFLLSKFLEKVPLKKAHDQMAFECARQEFFTKKVSKSAATIENHAGRSCRDWLVDVGLIFSKSQLCTKFDNRFRIAKAAQSIVCFQHEVLCRFAPYMRYIEKKLHEALPSRFYIHSGKGLEELDEWVRKGNFGGLCTESDYEAFDSSQDQYIVAFEVELMGYLGLPRDLINDYIYIKTHLGSKLGSFAIMRFSGEASTFLFNTMANMLFTFLRYELKGNEYICFTGDDMCASKRLTVKREHEQFLDKLRLKAKVQFTEKPTFCGWHLCPDGIYKKPQLVMERLCIARENNNLGDCIDNYAIEVAFAYRMGERAVNRMDEEELDAFYNCVRLIIRNKHLLKSNIRDTFERGEQ